MPTDIFPDMEGKVFYVWFDAPIGYISITKELLGDNYKQWWHLDNGADKVKYVEFMGKDNVPFHSITFPATLIGANENVYLESTGTQWIDTGFIPNQDTKIEAEYQFLSTSSSAGYTEAHVGSN